MINHPFIHIQNMYIECWLKSILGIKNSSELPSSWLVEFMYLKRWREVEDFYKLICHLGGMMSNPNAGAVGKPLEIPAPGQAVSMRDVTNMKLVIHFVRHKEHTSRAYAIGHVNLVSIHVLFPLRVHK